MAYQARPGAARPRLRRRSLAALLLASSLGLAGCPIYERDGRGCYRSYDCAPGYSCDRNSGACMLDGSGATGCNKPGDCGPTETCTSDRVCAPGDCSFYSCVAGYTCQIASGAWACVLDMGEAGAGGAAGVAGEAGAPSAGQGGG